MNYCFRCKITQEVEAQQIIALLIVKKYLEVRDCKLNVINAYRWCVYVALYL